VEERKSENQTSSELSEVEDIELNVL